MRLVFSAIALFSGVLFAQPVSVGVKVGVPFGDPYGYPTSVPFDVQKAQWTIGPTVEFGLPLGLSIGVDALYQSFSVRGSTSISGIDAQITGDAKRWDLPVYLKYKFGSRWLARPFIAAGAVAGVAWVKEQTLCGGGPCPRTSSNLDLVEGGVGIVVGGGIEFKAGPIKIAPEVRYTHWQTGILDSRRLNQTSLLAGFRF